MVGLFDEVAPDRRLAYPWEWNSDGEVFRVEVEFFEERSGECCVELLHTVFPNKSCEMLTNAVVTYGLRGFNRS